MVQLSFVLSLALVGQASALALDLPIRAHGRANAGLPGGINQANRNCQTWQPALASGGSSGGNGIRLRGGGGGGGGGDDGSSENPISKFWAKYLDLLDKKPLQTRMITGFLIGAVGDVISQFTGGSSFSTLDLKRILIFSSWGGFGFTPVGYNWYNLIEKTVPKDIPARFFWKMLMDQSVFPGFMTTVTFISLTIVEGLFAGISLTVNKGLTSTGAKVEGLPALFNAGVEKVKKELVPTLITNYKVWPLAQILNFAVVPIKLQVLFVNLVAVWWNFVLSMTQHS